MYARKRLDIGWLDLVAGILACGTARDRIALAARIESRWSALPCLSVRSGFDLYLRAVGLPPGSEVLTSAMTIADMPRILQHHGLVPVPVDLDMNTLAPRPELLARALTPATRAILVAHLFGSRVPLEPIVALAARHRLLLIEDCAQAFTGDDCVGNRGSDVAMFSFGSIKTATALGGALLCVRDPDVMARMKRLQAALPVQKRTALLRRLVKYTILKALSTRAAYASFTRICRGAGLDHDALIHGATRGFAADRLFTEIRRAPAAPLLALLERRLSRYPAARVTRRAAIGESLTRRLPRGVERPGRRAAAHTHWVFPIVGDDPTAMIDALAREGFDATRRSSLIAVEPPPGREELDPVEVRRALARMVFLPVYPELPAHALARLARVLSAGTRRAQTGAPSDSATHLSIGSERARA